MCCQVESEICKKKNPPSPSSPWTFWTLVHVREVGAAELLCCSQGATPTAAGRPRVLSGSRWSAPRAPHLAMESARAGGGQT